MAVEFVSGKKSVPCSHSVLLKCCVGSEVTQVNCPRGNRLQLCTEAEIMFLKSCWGWGVVVEGFSGQEGDIIFLLCSVFSCVICVYSFFQSSAHTYPFWWASCKTVWLVTLICFFPFTHHPKNMYHILMSSMKNKSFKFYIQVVAVLDRVDLVASEGNLQALWERLLSCVCPLWDNLVFVWSVAWRRGWGHRRG